MKSITESRALFLHGQFTAIGAQKLQYLSLAAVGGIDIDKKFTVALLGMEFIAKTP